MRKITIGLPAPLADAGKETLQQLTDVYVGCGKVLQGLGDLETCVKLIRVTFQTVGQDPAVGPNFHVIFQDPLSTECSHSTDFRFIGDKKTGTYGSTTPTADAIADHLLEALPSFIREHLARGAVKLAEVNAEFKRLGKDGCRIEFVRESIACGRVPHRFRADTEDEAFRYVAQYLKIPYPPTEEAFRARGGVAVYANFTRQIFPQK